MAEVAATLNMDTANTIPIIDNDNDNIPTTITTMSPSNQKPEITDRSVEEFKIKVNLANKSYSILFKIPFNNIILLIRENQHCQQQQQQHQSLHLRHFHHNQPMN